jgi:hypothetical protein
MDMPPVTLYWVIVDDCGFILGVFPRREEKRAREYAEALKPSVQGPIEVCPGGIQGHLFYEKP